MSEKARVVSEGAGDIRRMLAEFESQQKTKIGDFKVFKVWDLSVYDSLLNIDPDAILSKLQDEIEKT